MFVAPVSPLLICCVKVAIFPPTIQLNRPLVMRLGDDGSDLLESNPDGAGLDLRCTHLSRRGVPSFDSLNGILERLFQNSLSDRPNHEANQPSLEVLAIAYCDEVNVGQAVGTARKGVGVAGRPSPSVGVGRL